MAPTATHLADLSGCARYVRRFPASWRRAASDRATTPWHDQLFGEAKGTGAALQTPLTPGQRLGEGSTRRHRGGLRDTVVDEKFAAQEIPRHASELYFAYCANPGHYIADEARNGHPSRRATSARQGPAGGFICCRRNRSSKPIH